MGLCCYLAFSPLFSGENVKIFVDSAEIPIYPLKSVVTITSGWKDEEMRKARREEVRQKGILGGSRTSWTC